MRYYRRVVSARTITWVALILTATRHRHAIHARLRAVLGALSAALSFLHFTTRTLTPTISSAPPSAPVATPPSHPTPSSTTAPRSSRRLLHRPTSLSSGPQTPHPPATVPVSVSAPPPSPSERSPRRLPPNRPQPPTQRHDPQIQAVVTALATPPGRSVLSVAVAAAVRTAMREMRHQPHDVHWIHILVSALLSDNGKTLLLQLAQTIVSTACAAVPSASPRHDGDSPLLAAALKHRSFVAELVRVAVAQAVRSYVCTKADLNRSVARPGQDGDTAKQVDVTSSGHDDQLTAWNVGTVLTNAIRSRIHASFVASASRGAIDSVGWTVF